MINDYNNHRLNNMGDELTKMFEYLFNRNRRGDQSKIDKYETLYEEKLNKAYPMLPYLRDNIPTTMLVSYLNEKDA